MNSLLYYYNNVQKMAAYRQAKRMQRGALTTQGGFSTTDPALLQLPCTIQCVFSLRELDGVDSTIFATTRDNNGCKIQYRSDRKRILITDANAFYSIENASPDKVYNITLVCDTNATKAYYGGNEVISNSNKAIISIYYIGSLENSNRFNGDYLLHRHFNYAKSADEVKALDNNGDPMGYVVPKAMRAIDVPFPAGSYTESNYVFFSNSGSITRQEFNIPQGNGFSGQFMRFSKITALSIYCQYWLVYLNKQRSIKLNIEYRSSVAFSISNKGQKVNYAANTGDALTTSISYYAGETNPLAFEDADDSWVEIRVLSIEPIGLLAEYLPQNLMYGRDDKTIATLWLDSAKQLPLSDEYMEPLFQSIGGYDMAANGAPDILYNE